MTDEYVWGHYGDYAQRSTMNRHRWICNDGGYIYLSIMDDFGNLIEVK